MVKDSVANNTVQYSFEVCTALRCNFFHLYFKAIHRAILSGSSRWMETMFELLYN